MQKSLMALYILSYYSPFFFFFAEFMKMEKKL